jgi:GNAT superfamily N-acetyltransferase
VTTVRFTEDPSQVLEEAGAFLRREPVTHNLILSLLHLRVARPRPGRYWMVMEDGLVSGVVFQSPLDFGATITPMPLEAVVAVVDAITDRNVELPAVHGEAATAARFAGQWAERRKSAAAPTQGHRLYELTHVETVSAASGMMRQMEPRDRDLVLAWGFAFAQEIGEPGADPTAAVDSRSFFVWEDDDVCAMAAHTPPVENVVRVQYVYTPPPLRRRGYAGACVGELSRLLKARGHRVILFTNLENPTSNSIYRRIGYRAVQETLRYRFGDAAASR